jgi:RHS repeat-associated protein
MRKPLKTWFDSQSGVTASGPAALADDRTDHYDAVGDILTMTDQNGTVHQYSYDCLGRQTLDAISTFGPGAGIDTTICAIGTAYNALGLVATVSSYSSTVTGDPNCDNQAVTYQTTSGTVSLTYDADGSLTIDQTGNHLTYDAWDRLVAVSDSSNNPVAAYTYDGMGRQIKQTTGDGTTDLYYDEAGQVVEEAQGGVVTNDYVWSLAYVNAMVARVSYNPSGNGSVTQILYAQYDANFDVTSLVDGTPGSETNGHVLERFIYDPYGGSTTITNTGWTPITGATPGTDPCNWIYLFQGGRYDVNTGNYTFGARAYSPLLQRWTQLDPAGYPNGLNAYQFVNDNPTSRADPSGEMPAMRMDPVSGATSPSPVSPGNAAAAANAAAMASADSGLSKYGSCSPQATSIAAGMLGDLRIVSVCFAKGTLVLLADGTSQAIESIEPGQMVLATPDGDPENAPTPCKVLEVYHNEPRRIFEAHIAGEVVRATAKHPFYVKGKGWVALSELVAGDQLRDQNGRSVPVQKAIDSGQTEPVFNLRVEGNHTYFVVLPVARCAVLVHNDSASDSDNWIERQFHHLENWLHRHRMWIDSGGLHGKLPGGWNWGVGPLPSPPPVDPDAPSQVPPVGPTINHPF